MDLTQLIETRIHRPEAIAEAAAARRRPASALSEHGARAEVSRLAVREMPRSGKPDELLAAYGIDAEAIAGAARALVAAGAPTA